MQMTNNRKKTILKTVCVICVLLMLAGTFSCVMGYEAVSTGINPGAWYGSLVALIIIPFLVMAFCIRRILKLRDK